MDIRPEKVLAFDKDSLQSPIHYTFFNGTPSSYLSYFLIDGSSGKFSNTFFYFFYFYTSTIPGIIRQIRAIDNDFETRFEIFIKATEVTERRRSAVAKLNVFVQALNSHPPVIKASSLVGYVPENSPLGTVVVSVNNHQPIQFVVLDSDLVLLFFLFKSFGDLTLVIFAEPERPSTKIRV